MKYVVAMDKWMKIVNSAELAKWLERRMFGGSEGRRQGA